MCLLTADKSQSHPSRIRVAWTKMSRSTSFASKFFVNTIISYAQFANFRKSKGRMYVASWTSVMDMNIVGASDFLWKWEQFFNSSNVLEQLLEVFSFAVLMSEIDKRWCWNFVVLGLTFLQTGPLLITHWGLSGPLILRLSAWAARYLHSSNYQGTRTHPASTVSVIFYAISFTSKP